MTVWQTIALLITLTALFSFSNHRFIRLPTTIGVMLIALILSLVLIGLSKLGFGIEVAAESLLNQIDFNEALMQGMLSFLLFAGALHINLGDLARQRLVIGVLATLGVLISTLLVGTAVYFVSGWLDLGLPYAFCLLFGALISPTDPIAVLGILKSARVPKSLEIKVAGESLFNDGIGVVVFIVLYEIAVGRREISFPHIGSLFLMEAVGGIVLGLILGWVAYRMLKSVDNYQVEVLITLALVMGGYSLATALHTSGPIAIVVAGLLIGNQGRSFAMSESTREHLDTFWELVDEILNAVLFVLIGLEVLLLSFRGEYLLAGLIAIPLVLLVRFISVGLPVMILRRWREFTPGAIRIMTWGGLRGGISVALALSLPAGSQRDLLLTMTYMVVIFSILVQGVTIKSVVKKAMAKEVEL
jgi:CPA1 family monovalent cation:H+ antiporter